MNLWRYELLANDADASGRIAIGIEGDDELNRPEFCIMSSKILRGLRDASTQGIYA